MSIAAFTKPFPGAFLRAACLAASLLIFSPQAAAQSPSSATGAGDFSGLRDWISLQEDLLKHLDRTFIELDAALDVNDFDADSLVDFVRREIGFQQYPGVVRGALGTLQTRSGNALDQSLLLATLLGNAGYDARIVHARISPDMAAGLLQQMTRIPDSPQVYGDGAGDVLLRIAEFLRAHETASDEPAGEWEAELEEHRQLAGRLSGGLAATLANDGVSLERVALPLRVIEEARDYYWCQYRDSASSGWVDAHPAFDAEPAAFDELQPETYYKDQIPEELLQQVTFALFASRRIGANTETTKLMQSWTRPAANLYAAPVVVSLIPSQLSRLAEDDYDGSSDLFLPHLNESLAPGAQAFSLSGSIAPPDAAMSNMAGVFKTVEERLGSAATALQGLGATGKESQKPVMALEDVWLEVSLSGPGTDPDRRWRRSFRADGGAAPPTGHSLAKRVVINLAAGPLSPAQSYDQSLRLHIEALKSTINKQSASRGDAVQNLFNRKTAPYEVDRTVLEGIADFMAYLDLLAPNDERGVSYRHQPLIVAKHYNLFPDSGEPEGLDIISNARRSFTFDDRNQPEFAPGFSLDFGVAEAITELAVVDWEHGSSINAVTEYQPVLEGATPAVLLKSGDALAQPAEGSLSGQRIRESVSEGRIVISPPRQESGDDIRAWWEIDPTTGETVGVTRNGWGGSYMLLASVTEEIVTRKIMIATGCLMMVQSACRMYSNTAVAAIAVGISGSGFVGCKAFMMTVLGDLPPGIPDPCDALKQGDAYVRRALRGTEEWLYKFCTKRALPECVKTLGAPA